MNENKKVVAQFAYERSGDQGKAGEAAHHPVIIIGAGPVGLSLALDLAQRGVRTVLLDDADRIGEGSRGICWSKRTLEILDRLGVGEPLVAKGVVWQKGRVFLREREVYQFDLLPEGGHKMPAFINLQQYYLEQELVGAINQERAIDLRWRNKVVGIAPRNDGAVISVDTPDGPYTLSCDWLLCCDGARSSCRDMLGLTFRGEVFEDRFLIADVKMTAAFPTERWFWFDPPFHSGQSALLHKQPDDVWRIDLQLGPEADAEAERAPERVLPRIERMLGHRNFDLEWVSIYTFQCRRMDRFAHNRVIFAGDAAHQVSPFGARGANSGIQDAENLAWKLAAVLSGAAPASLIASYEDERGQAADENIRHSTRSTDFIAPRTATERAFRNAALDLAASAPFARRFVNSGRLSTPKVYDSPLSTPDGESFSGDARPGAVMPDAPIVQSNGGAGYALGAITAPRGGFQPTLVHWGGEGGADDVRAFASKAGIHCVVVGSDVRDASGHFTQRLDARVGTTYVLRPDQHVAARFRSFDAARLTSAVDRLNGKI